MKNVIHNLIEESQKFLFKRAKIDDKIGLVRLEFLLHQFFEFLSRVAIVSATTIIPSITVLVFDFFTATPVMLMVLLSSLSRLSCQSPSS